MSLYSNRVEKYSVDLLDTNDQFIRKLNTTSGGQLNFDDGVEVKHAGSIITLNENGVDWNSVRVRPMIEILGVGEFPLGVYVPTAPSSSTPSVGGSQTIEIHDKTIILSRDMPGMHYCIGKGTNVVDKVLSILADFGQTSVSVTPSEMTTSEYLIFEPDVTWLTIVNKLLISINYNELTVDYQGNFLINPHLDHGSQPIVATFERGSRAIYRANWVKNQDIGNIPNRVILVSEGTGSEEALTGTAVNNNPDSPYSYHNRQYWLTHYESGIEAETPTVMQQLAERKLVELTTPSTTINVEHMWLDLKLHEKIRFAPSNHDPIDVIIDSMRIELKPGSLVNAVWKEVVKT